jgi:hypothetical protein
MAAARALRRQRPVVLSYGMGTESSAILLRWLHDPATRDFDLRDLVVLTSMTGDEFPDTGRLVTTHVLPRLRAAHVRLVQVARAGPRQADGVIILDDSRAPSVLYLEGAYPLAKELRAAGTTPQLAHGRRLCSLHCTCQANGCESVGSCWLSVTAFAVGPGASAKTRWRTTRPLLLFRRPCKRTRRWYP